MNDSDIRELAQLGLALRRIDAFVRACDMGNMEALAIAEKIDAECQGDPPTMCEAVMTVDALIRRERWHSEIPDTL